jgi:hypothetical protein
LLEGGCNTERNRRYVPIDEAWHMWEMMRYVPIDEAWHMWERGTTVSWPLHSHRVSCHPCHGKGDNDTMRSEWIRKVRR